ncbi:hypothetical protein NC651_011790 [Populus alba x Populus x berolinensis]|nr:hypothetical protein NC651_011790 [Populus alba x Populus x berolinensis]
MQDLPQLLTISGAHFQIQVLCFFQFGYSLRLRSILSVCSLSNLLESSFIYTQDTNVTKSVSVAFIVPPEVESFLRVAAHGSLCTRDFLCKRRVIPASENSCSFFHSHEETIIHLFLEFFELWRLWSRILNWWWGCHYVQTNSVSLLFVQWRTHGKMQRKFRIFNVEGAFCRRIITYWIKVKQS